MRTLPSTLKIITAAVSLLAMVAVWLMFAPQQFGGQAAYVLVTGNSMEPFLDKGDMVVVRATNDIAVGDVVTYQYPDLGHVIHRVVDIQQGAYILKGDNNEWVDGYTPSQSEIIGEYWFKLPKASGVIKTLRTPWVFALSVGIATLFLGVSMIESPAPKRKQRSSRTIEILPSVSAQLALWKESIWSVLIFVGLLFFLLGIFSFTRPTSKPTTIPVEYQQSGMFSYSGAAGQEIYDSNRLQSGDPIFTSLTCNVDLAFDYNIAARQPVFGGGSYVLTTQLTSSNGWTRTVGQTPKATFEGSAAHIEQAINFCDLQAYVQRVQETTGVGSQRYLFNVLPQVDFVGTAEGAIIQDSFAPVLSFVMEDNQIYVSKANSNETDPLAPVSQGSIMVESLVPNTLSIFGLILPVVSARYISVIGGGLVLLMAVLIWSAIKANNEVDDLTRAQITFRDSLLDCSDVPATSSDQVIDLKTLESFSQVVQRLDQVVLMHQTPDTVDFYAAQGHVFYRYRLHRTPEERTLTS